MDSVGTCGVCQKSRKGMNRLGGMDVCDVCTRGGAAQAVIDRGWRLDTRNWVVQTKDHTWYFVESNGISDVDSTLKATFRMKQGLWFWLGMLPFWPIRLADPLFNKLVLATSATRPKTVEFLQSEGAQSAVMDLVGEGAAIFIDGRKIQAYCRSQTMPDPSRVEAETAVLMAHLEVFGELGGG